MAALVFGSELTGVIENLNDQDIDSIICCEDESLAIFHGERYARLLADIAGEKPPACLLMVDSPVTADLAPRLAAILGTALVTRSVGFSIESNGDILFVRPVANGFLSEETRLRSGAAFIATFLPAVLGEWERNEEKKTSQELRQITPGDMSLQTQWIEFQQADPGDMDLEDAEIIVAGGRGVGKDHFDPVFQLADCLGGSVGVTRPVVDWNLVPFDRQIGQTGKTVSPELIVNCGISGANEYTAGMEKSKQVIAINVDARSRIFDFADLGAVGDVQEILPLLI
ncbi:MAG: electron transfer flavoprotein subunit alpha/FixB family protein, partial [Proteobacteria bacterium]|nr:electron transfer flavoprotein subunit alpha/FixB family protein [Pseudomonadota bacterium]